MFDHELAEVYDLIYRRRGKDYAAEAADITALIRRHRPGAASVLDVACGTGEHLVHLGRHFDHAEGLEMSAGMLGIARAKAPNLTVHEADMRTFRLPRAFDAVTCLFSSIAYLGTREGMVAAVDRMAAHLVPGGVLIVEPWWSPDRFIDKYVSSDVVGEDGRSVARVSRTRRTGAKQAEMEVHFVMADPSRIHHFSETHTIALFTREEHLDAFRRSGCTAEFVEGGPSGTGLYVAVRSG
ncbi:class I SAM-dependent methyltransferase [Actinomadura algeriensis]|uniref:SAM-dependent methyltransferase n=1 Tax=Actinomadura algeriensis TaxID=1679523 RepID=A0ABR9JIX9_9ACTN|nr:class I SAM-dependent methyltransferase [Actinomadura algeriensis]MBE1530507.1 SAM-dependent methyltransferase [Actinomadura algeriensis]